MNNRLKNWYYHLRLGQKLLVINSITVGVAMLLLLLSIAIMYVLWQRNQILEQTAIQAQFFSENLTASLSFNDQDSAQEVLNSLRNSPYVTHADLLDADGNYFAEFRRGNERVSNHMPFNLKLVDQRGRTFQFGFYNLNYLYVVKLNNKKLGYFYIALDIKPIYKQALKFGLLSLIAMGIAAVIDLILLNRLQRILMAPLQNLIQLMRYISKENDYSKRHVLYSHDEMGELAEGFNEMLEKIQDRDNSLGMELKQKEITERRLDRLAHYDVVTHLPNRHFFNHSLAKIARTEAASDVKFGLMFIDLDNFKMVNDTLGHPVGDKLLDHVAVILKETVRGDDIVARLGGDEFGIILPNLEHPENAATIAQKLITRISSPTNLDNHDVVIGASIGISFFPADTSNIDTLMQNADTAMYHAKDKGKNNFQFFDSDMRARVQSRMDIETDLRKALEEKHFYLEYQPQFDINTRQVIGVEALLRWQHPVLGRISPNEFISVAEESGLIIPIGEWVFDTACQQAKRWHDLGLPLTIAVNVSPRQFNEANLLQKFNHILAKVGADASWIELEITEGALMDGSDSVINKLHTFAREGFKLSIDDFGTGYSSLSYLKRFPISKLKIDRSFIIDIESNKDDKAIAHAIIAMSNSLDMQVIAEGIETEQQAQCLLNYGCYLGQGFLVSPSVTAERIEALCGVESLALAATA